MNLHYARWATKKEIDAFHSYIKTKKQSKEEFTNKWLANNGSTFIQAHQSFYNDYLQEINNKAKDNYARRVSQYHKDLIEYESLKNGNGRCDCKGNLRLVKHSEYEFIGCENFRERGFEHFKKYKPSKPWEIEEEKEVEISTNYLTKLKTLNGFPKELKESILYEYLSINNIDTLVDLSNKYTMLPNIQKKSSRRESIIKPILDSVFEKVYFQKYILIKEHGKRERLLRPDFICIRQNICYVIEQKKNEENINDQQLNNYIAALSYMISQSDKRYSIKGLFIIEEGEYDLENNIYTIDTILSI